MAVSRKVRLLLSAIGLLVAWGSALVVPFFEPKHKDRDASKNNNRAHPDTQRGDPAHYQKTAQKKRTDARLWAATEAQMRALRACNCPFVAPAEEGEAEAGIVHFMTLGHLDCMSASLADTKDAFMMFGCDAVLDLRLLDGVPHLFYFEHHIALREFGLAGRWSMAAAQACTTCDDQPGMRDIYYGRPSIIDRIFSNIRALEPRARAVCDGNVLELLHLRATGAVATLPPSQERFFSEFFGTAGDRAYAAVVFDAYLRFARDAPARACGNRTDAELADVAAEWTLPFPDAADTAARVALIDAERAKWA